ncbi:MAG: hypothetical protein JSU70_15455 [Phycisphaerales bacterium]|nr:MAG: hypothetical protein JSU70_15455 [Phycisphaerales bacterium]
MKEGCLIIFGIVLCLSSAGNPAAHTEVTYACDAVTEPASPWSIKMPALANDNGPVSASVPAQHRPKLDYLLTRQFILAPAGSSVDCLPECHKDYQEWVDAGKPACWCHPRQCYGDVDSIFDGDAKTGNYRVGPRDFNLLLAGWMVKEPPHGPGIASVQNGICADFAHDKAGDEKTGYFRVGLSDLNILIVNWLVKRPPKGRGIGSDCRSCKQESPRIPDDLP